MSKTTRPNVAGWPSRYGPLIVILTVSAGLGARTVLLVRRYSVNILYWDQWDFYSPLFENAPDLAILFLADRAGAPGNRVLRLQIRFATL